MANWLPFTRAHCAVYRGTRGLIGGNLIGIQMLLLTTRGRKTGLPRTLPLAYVEHKGDYIVVASNGGAEKPPAWWLNLRASEIADVQVRGERFSVGWTAAPHEERMEYWRRLQAAIPAYRMYRLRTDREIPIVLLKRKPEGWQTRDLSTSSAHTAAAPSNTPPTTGTPAPPQSSGK
jgi:deazaflavin-dependent oxidoreductase (nitroreductase family)